MSNEARLTLNLSPEMVNAVDDYWHSEQLRSRNEAIRELLGYALHLKLLTSAAEGKPAKETRK